MIALTQVQQSLVDGIKSQLVKNKLETDLCQNLKQQDFMDCGYMTH